MESLPRYEDLEWRRGYQARERDQKPPFACYPTLFHISFLAICIMFIIIWSQTKTDMDLREHNCPLSTFAAAVSAFTITFASFTSLLFYVNWTICFISARGTKIYRDQVLDIARKSFFLLLIGISEGVYLIPKVPLVRDLRSHSFLHGITAFMLALIIVNLSFFRVCLECLQLWKHGKVILMGWTALAMCTMAIVPENGESKVEEDRNINGWFMGLYGALTGFIFSNMWDWFLLDSSRQGLSEHLELRSNGNTSEAGVPVAAGSCGVSAPPRARE